MDMRLNIARLRPKEQRQFAVDLAYQFFMALRAACHAMMQTLSAPCHAQPS
jgi:hypothetical protein